MLERCLSCVSLSFVVSARMETERGLHTTAAVALLNCLHPSITTSLWGFFFCLHEFVNNSTQIMIDGRETPLKAFCSLASGLRKRAYKLHSDMLMRVVSQQYFILPKLPPLLNKSKLYIRVSACISCPSYVFPGSPQLPRTKTTRVCCFLLKT